MISGVFFTTSDVILTTSDVIFTTSDVILTTSGIVLPACVAPTSLWVDKKSVRAGVLFKKIYTFAERQTMADV